MEHIGSTSVPGLPAKPVIDLAVRVRDAAEVRGLDAVLVAGGWVDVAAGPRTHEVRVRLGPDGARTHIAHFFAAATWDVVPQRLFAAWLREHPTDRDRYAAIKADAVATGLHGRAYTAAKTAVVQEIVDRARAARGLSPVPVSDKARSR